jgi:hypothetical protein
MKNDLSALRPSWAGGSAKQSGLGWQLGAFGADVSARYNSSLNPEPQQKLPLRGRVAARLAARR